MSTADSDTTKHYAWLGKLIAEDRNSKDSTCDLILESERKQFPVHKNIMMLVSKYFKKMFNIEMKEKYEGIVKMLQIPHQRLANLIEFIYSGRIKITEENLTDILDDAEYTELEALKEICKTVMLRLVSTDNCLKLRAYAQRYNLDEVFVKTNQEITTSFAAVVQHDDFVQLDVDDLSAVIKLRNKTCEEAVFTGIVKWVNHNPLQREELFVNLLSQIDFNLMSPEFLAQISTEDLVRNNAECLHLLVDALAKVIRLTFTIDKFLIIGGEYSSYNCVVYDLIAKQPTHLPKLNFQRDGANSVKVGNKVYVTGGWNDESGRSCEMLNLEKPTKWNVLPNMMEFRSYFGSCFIADHIYVTGGRSQHCDDLSSCEKFNIYNNKWMRVNSMWHARAKHGTVVCRNSLYCIGGYDGRKILSSCEQYNVWSGVWNEIAPLNQARKGLACVVLDGNIYAIGGQGYRGQFLSTVERFNPAIGRWVYVASLKHARYYSSACVIRNKIFVFGGFDGEDLTSVEVYKPTSNVWTIAFEMENPIDGATVVAI